MLCLRLWLALHYMYPIRIALLLPVSPGTKYRIPVTQTSWLTSAPHTIPSKWSGPQRPYHIRFLDNQSLIFHVYYCNNCSQTPCHYTFFKTFRSSSLIKTWPLLVNIPLQFRFLIFKNIANECSDDMRTVTDFSNYISRVPSSPIPSASTT